MAIGRLISGRVRPREPLMNSRPAICGCTSGNDRRLPPLPPSIAIVIIAVVVASRRSRAVVIAPHSRSIRIVIKIERRRLRNRRIGRCAAHELLTNERVATNSRNRRILLRGARAMRACAQSNTVVVVWLRESDELMTRERTASKFSLYYNHMYANIYLTTHCSEGGHINNSQIIIYN